MNQTKTPIVFFGTNDFAAGILQGLLENPSISVKLIVTQPDKPIGRKKTLHAPPVKVLAEKHGISIEQPATLKNYSLSIQDSFLGITAQYGLLIPQSILDAFPHGILNVHTSLLPKYRGASPIQSAILHGETETGVTIMRMDAGLDTGPILLQKKIAIAPDDTAQTLEEKLIPLANTALTEALEGYLHGQLAPQPQDDQGATTCKELTREDGQIDWKKSAIDIYNAWRAFTPWPGIWTLWQAKRIKLLDVAPVSKTVPPGQVEYHADLLLIGCGDGALAIRELQLEGRRAAAVSIFIPGHPDFLGAVLGK